MRKPVVAVTQTGSSKSDRASSRPRLRHLLPADPEGFPTSSSAGGRRLLDRVPHAAIAALAIAVGAGNIGCSPSSRDNARNDDANELEREFEALVAGYDEKTGARQILVDDLLRRRGTDEQVVLVDVREPREHSVSALDGAVLLPLARVRTAVPDDLPIPAGEALVVAYCTAGYRSGLAAVQLEKLLGRPVHSLHGGIIAWFNAGGRVVDPADGSERDEIDAFGPQWSRYVRPRS